MLPCAHVVRLGLWCGRTALPLVIRSGVETTNEWVAVGGNARTMDDERMDGEERALLFVRARLAVAVADDERSSTRLCIVDQVAVRGRRLTIQFQTPKREHWLSTGIPGIYRCN